MRRTPQGPWFSLVVILVASSSFARGRISSGAVSVGDSKRQFERRLCFGETDESGCRENILCWWIAAKDECLSLTADNGFFIGAGDAGLEFDAPDEISQDRCSYFVTQSVCQRDSSCMWTESCIPVASLAESVPPTRSPTTPEPTSLSPTASAPISLNPTQLQPVPTTPPTTLKPSSSSPTTSISATNMEQSRDPEKDETETNSQPNPSLPVQTSPPTSLKPTSSSQTTSISATNIEQSLDPENDEETVSPAPEEGDLANDLQLSLQPEEDASGEVFNGGDEDIPQQRYTVLYSIEIKPWNVQNDWIPPSWNSITEEHVSEHSIEMIKDEDLETYELLTTGEGSKLSVSIIIDSAKLTSAPSLKINFYTAIVFESRKSDWDADGIVASAFDSLFAQKEYVQKLNEDPLFADVRSVAVDDYSVKGSILTEAQESKAASSGSILYIIVGLVGLSWLSI